mgnify:FL=1|tara:strand:+ start:1855 stop:2187 length:333 start_codon:yes stop_codon:yes gene_type:complete
MKELFELRVYPEPSDAYEKDGEFYLIWKYVTLDQANELIATYGKLYELMYAPEGMEDEVGNMRVTETTDDRLTVSITTGEVVAVSHTDGKRYFEPRDGFNWMDVDKTDEI